MATRGKKLIQLGLDYGTSASKIAYRDELAAGGPKTHLACVDRDDCRFPATVRVDGDRLFFGHAALAGKGVRYESLKMRAAREVDESVRACFQVAALPDGFTAYELATLSVWWLMCQALAALTDRYTAHSKLEDFQLRYQLGIPVDFYRRPRLREAFERIGGRAWWLFNERPTFPSRLTLGDARGLLDSACAAAPRPAPVQPEAKAALLWTLDSPHVPEGPYLKIDIGAGTTNASAFRLVGEGARRTTDRICVFGSSSVSSGMDWIGELLAPHLDGEVTPKALRGSEDGHLGQKALWDAVQPAVSDVAAAGAWAWTACHKKNAGAKEEARAWREKCRVFVLGGGSLVAPLKHRMRRHPYINNVTFPAVDLSAPNDLDLDQGKDLRTALPFALVAYGLADPNIDALTFVLPEDIDSIAPLEPTEPARCVCGGTSEECVYCGGTNRRDNTSRGSATALGATIAPQSVIVECEYCHRTVKRDVLRAHLRECPKTPDGFLAYCSKCGVTYLASEIAAHEASCTRLPKASAPPKAFEKLTTCPMCRKSVPVALLREHKRFLCPARRPAYSVFRRR